MNQSAPAPAIAPYDRVADLAKAAECVERGDEAWRKGDLEQAHDRYRCSVERRARYMLETQKELLESRFRLALVLASACRLTEAKELLGIVRSGTRPSPRLASLGGGATLSLASIAWATGYRAEAVRLVRDVAMDCRQVGVKMCNEAHSALALMARLFPSAERPSIEPLVQQLEASYPTPYGRQFTRLAIYEVLMARPEPEAATRFALENDILASRGTPWPTSVFPTATECSAPLTWNEAERLELEQRQSAASIHDCLKVLGITDAERPPAVDVAILLAPDGTPNSIEVAGTAISPEVLKCVTTAAQRVRAPAVESGYRLYDLSLRLD